MNCEEEFSIAERLAKQRLEALFATDEAVETGADGVDSDASCADETAADSCTFDTVKGHITKEVYERLTNGESFAQRLALEQDVDLEEARRDVDRKIAREQKVLRPHRRMWWGWAASVAAAIVICFVVFHSRLDVPQSVEKPIMLTNNNEQVELILANGDHIALADSGKANAALPDGFDNITGTTGEKRLVYNQSEQEGEAVEKTPSFITLRVPKKGNYQMELPDGTIVYLNSCSSLRFPEHFSQVSRDVYLTGEAAFSVKKNAKAPFRVHTDSRVIVVTGTQFNVCAYKGEPTWQATLLQGGIRVEGGSNTVTMRPLQRYTFRHADGKEILRNISADEAVLTPWLVGILNFEDATLAEIERKLQKWYDFSFVYEDESLKYLRFTASLRKNESSEEFFNLLSKTAKIHFVQDGEKIRVYQRE